MEEIKEIKLDEIFNKLSSIDVSDKIEKKNKLNYLSWAYAWMELKKIYPTANYCVYETTNPDGYVCNYFTDGKTCWVKVGVSIGFMDHVEMLPVMNNYNKSIKLQDVTSFDVNTSIQRALTKAIARFGLGLSIYAGEDVPEELPKDDNAAISKLLDHKITNLEKVRTWASQHKLGTTITMDLADKIIELKQREEE